MPKGLICGKWEIPLLKAEPGTKSSFLSHVNAGELSRRALCFEWLIDGIPEEKTWLEPFGGIGLQSIIIQNVAKPSSHLISDLDANCAAQVGSLMKDAPGVMTACGDALDIMTSLMPDADVVVLDFPNMTPHKFPIWRNVMDHVFLERKPRLVEFTDVSPRFLHLHKAKYSETLGSPIETKEDYILALSKYMHRHYEYSVVKAAYKSSTAYMCLGSVPYHEEPEMKFFGPDMSGFRYIDDN